MDYKDLLKQSMTYMPTADQLKGLLSPQQTRLQAGLLGASSGVLPLMGVRDRPVGLGEVLLAAGTGAQAGLQQKQQSDLTSALQGLSIASTLKDLSKSDLDLSNYGKIAQDAGFTPGTPEFFAYVNQLATASKAPVTNINMVEDIFAKEGVEAGFKKLGELQAEVQNNESLNNRLELLQDLLIRGETDTGKLQSAMLPIKQTLASFGFLSQDQLDDLSAQELFNATANYIVPRLRVTGSGSTSDKEIALFASSTAGLSNTVEGNKLIIGGTQSILDYTNKRLKLSEDYFSRNKNLLGFEQYAQENLGPVYESYSNDQEFDQKVNDGLLKEGDFVFDNINGQFRILTAEDVQGAFQ
jgi:hypothetical protein